jgi:hypothetical protein
VLVPNLHSAAAMPLSRLSRFVALWAALYGFERRPQAASEVARDEQSQTRVDSSPSDPNVTFWLSGGVGPALIGGDAGIGERFEMTAGLRGNTLTLRLGHAAEIADCGPCYVQVSPINTNTEIALLYGIMHRGYGYLLSASVGPAAIWTTERGNSLIEDESAGYGTDQYNTIKRFTVGATWELGAYLSSRFCSFGPTLTLTADAVQSTAAILVDLHFGYMGASE